MQAKDVMTMRVVSISPTADLRSAALKMRANNISGLPVIDHDNRLVGILTEGDLLRRIAEDRSPRSSDDIEHDDPQCLNNVSRSMRRSVRDVMSRKVVTIGPDADVVEIARTLLSHRIKRVLVTRRRKASNPLDPEHAIRQRIQTEDPRLA